MTANENVQPNLSDYVSDRVFEGTRPIPEEHLRMLRDSKLSMLDTPVTFRDLFRIPLGYNKYEMTWADYLALPTKPYASTAYRFAFEAVTGHGLACLAVEAKARFSIFQFYYLTVQDTPILLRNAGAGTLEFAVMADPPPNGLPRNARIQY